MITAAKSDLMAAFEPVPVEGSPKREEWRAALTSRLNPLAAKIAPTMSKDQAAAWRNAMLDALADLPAMIGLTAAKRAIHVPMTFVNEVEGVVRKIAAEISDARRDAIARLERLIADLERANQPALPTTPDEDVPPPTPEQIRAMKPEWIELGLTKGYLTQEMIDEARHGIVPDRPPDHAVAQTG